MNTLQTLAMLLPISLSSGVNFYATILVIGLSIRLGWAGNVPAGFEVLATNPVLIVAGLFYAIEFFADKIPFVDNVWDLIHTFIRPLGAALLAAMAFLPMDPTIAVVAALAAGGVALVSHSGKASTRVAVNVASPLENVSNVSLSLAEDVGVGLLTVLALKYWWLAAAISLVILVLLIIFLPRLWSWTAFTLGAVFGRLNAWGGNWRESDPLPPDHVVLLDGRAPALSVRAVCQGVRGVGTRSGYLSVTDGGGLVFTWGRLRKHRKPDLPAMSIVRAETQRRALVDVLVVYYTDEKGRTRAARFAFTKDRWPAVERVMREMGVHTDPVSCTRLGVSHV